MKGEVDAITTKLDEGVRKIIDARVGVESLETALAEVATNVAQGNGTAAAKRAMHGGSQRRRGGARAGRRVGEDDDEGSMYEEEEEGDEGDDDDEEQEGGHNLENADENIGPAQQLQKKVEDQKLRYESTSLQQRYVFKVQGMAAQC